MGHKGVDGLVGSAGIAGQIRLVQCRQWPVFEGRLEGGETPDALAPAGETGDSYLGMFRHNVPALAAAMANN
ncbi:hypothetical protein [uncultured Thiodictyon sp.]|uniref:hypothetical protein n=1 Tax=uncultured Thiodictyon sp. TaxID=1846217 RepID=UPI0025CDA0E8|nr:hypothetical protein [uncultured Thiodictyon sp.]